MVRYHLSWQGCSCRSLLWESRIRSLLRPQSPLGHTGTLEASLQGWDSQPDTHSLEETGSLHLLCSILDTPEDLLVDPEDSEEMLVVH